MSSEQLRINSSEEKGLTKAEIEKASTRARTVQSVASRIEKKKLVYCLIAPYRYCAQSAVSYLIGTDILNFINQNESIKTTNLEISLSTPFLNDIAKTDDFFLKYITDTNTETMPNHSALIASIPSKHGGVGYRNPSRAALGAFTIPIARSIDYAIRGIKLGESRATIPNDHKYPFQNLIESTSGYPWKMISEIAPRILATFPILPNDTNNTNNHETNIRQTFNPTGRSGDLMKM
jgi:hypothetical protein